MNRLWMFLYLIVSLFLPSLLAVGCTGEQAVPGATCRATFKAHDGTIVTWESDKDTSAKNLKFNPSTGELEIQDLNSVGSALAPYQAAYMIQMSNNSLAAWKGFMDFVQAATPWIVRGGGAVSYDPNSGSPVILPLMEGAVKALKTTTQPAAPAGTPPLPGGASAQDIIEMARKILSDTASDPALCETARRILDSFAAQLPASQPAKN
ncbi:MAG: hypothetical protein ACE15C_14660 [Phycisphaerae bacterium]